MITYTCNTVPDDEGNFEEPRASTNILMRGGWTFHAYKRSHNGQAFISFYNNGFELHARGNRKKFLNRTPRARQGVYWSPNNRMVTMFTRARSRDPKKKKIGGQAIGVLHIDRVDWKQPDWKQPPLDIIYVPPRGHIPFGIEWSPKGTHVYVVEYFKEKYNQYSRIVKVDLSNKFESQKGVQEIVKIGGMIDFFMPPVSRFENGSGDSRDNYWIVFGHATGLFLTDPKGKYVRRIARLPAIGLQNIEWHPKNKAGQIALFFKRSVKNADGKRFRGVHLVHLDRVGRPEKGPLQINLHDKIDVHTLWYSPFGKYLSWATHDAVYFCKPETPKQVTKITFRDDSGVLLEGVKEGVKGLSWHDAEDRLAVTVGPHVFVQRIKFKKNKETKKLELVDPLLIKTFQRRTDFAAEPIWLKDEVFLTVFRDVTPKYKGGLQVHIPKKEDEKDKKKKKDVKKKKDKRG